MATTGRLVYAVPRSGLNNMGIRPTSGGARHVYAGDSRHPGFSRALRATRLKFGLGALALATLAGCAARPGSEPPIRTVGAMLRLSDRELAGGRPVELRGVVTFLDPAWRLLVIQDETGGVLVDLPSRPPTLLRGLLVEVNGATSADSHVPSVVTRSIRVIGPGSSPKPVDVSAQDVVHGKHAYRLVQLELTPENGALGDAAHTARFTAHPGSSNLVAIGRIFRRVHPSSLSGRRLRVRGVPLVYYTPVGEIDHVRLMFEDESDVDIIDQPAPQVPTATEPRNPGLPTLRSAREVKSLSAAEAARGYPVSVEGLVTVRNARHDGFVLQDGSMAVYVFRSPAEHGNPLPGQRVRVIGRSAMGGFAPIIRESQIDHLGLSGLPKPLPLVLAEPFRSVAENLWVELQGTATAIIPDGAATTLQLFSGTERVIVRFSEGDAPERLEPLLNAQVSVQGVYGPVFTAAGVLTGFRILTPSPAFVKIVSRPPAAAEPRSIASITHFDIRGFPRHRVRTAGSVTYRDDEGLVYLQDGDSALRVVGATAGQPRLHMRALLEGFISRDAAVPQLDEAHWISQAQGSPVAPVHALAETLLSGEFDGRLVVVDGFLENRRTISGRLQLNLQTGLARYTAALAAPASANEFPDLRPGALVRLSGICVTQASWESAGARLATLLLRTPDDLVVVRSAPWWDLRRSLYAASAASLLLVLALAWVVILRINLIRQIRLRSKLEDQLFHAQKLESLGRLAGGVAHDFNNYLTVILGYSSQLLSRLPPRDPSRAPLATIRRVSEQAAALTRELLAFGRRQVLKPVDCDLNELLVQAKHTLLPLVGESIEFVFRPAGHLDSVSIDPAQFMGVVVNLAVNARDAMPAGGKLTFETANVELDLKDAQQREGLHAGRYVRLTVSDTGTGMDVETRKRIFEPFFTTKQKGRGTGLGLAVVFGIVEQSGGHIEVGSEPGKGSTFRVYLPAAEPETRSAEAEPPAAPVSRHAAPPAAGPEIRPAEEPASVLRRQDTVLVVEDQDGVRTLVCAILKNKGLRVIDASDPARALELIESMPEPAQLLLTDMVMPGMSGHALSELVRARWPAIRILYMSGYSEDATAHQIGPDVSFIQKPFSPEQLARAVQSALSGTVTQQFGV